MNATLRQRLVRCKERIERRLDKRDNRGCHRPALTASNIHYELAERTRAIAAGGIGLIHQVVKTLGLDDGINVRLKLLKLHMPYHESDHVLNIAYNLLAGGACLEHLELRRNDEVYLDALGAADSRSHDGWRLLPAVRQMGHPSVAGNIQRSPAQGVAATTRVVLRGSDHRRRWHDGRDARRVQSRNGHQS